MENIEKKTPLNDLMDTTMDKIRDMVDSNTIIGEPITTPDGVTVIPVSRVSFGFGAGGGDYGKTDTAHFGGGAGAGVKVDPVAFPCAGSARPRAEFRGQKERRERYLLISGIIGAFRTKE